MTVDEIFARAEPDLNSGCWLWVGCVARGYGRIRRQGVTHFAHRVAWAAFHGVPLPDSRMLVCHKCDTPACVNPNHLFLGTARDNILDMVAKGRWRPRSEPLSPAARQRLSAGQQARRARERAALPPKVISPEERAERQLAGRAKWRLAVADVFQSEEYRALLRDRAKALWTDPEYREKNSSSRRKQRKPLSEETKRKIAEAATARHARRRAEKADDAHKRLVEAQNFRLRVELGYR